MRGPTFNCIFNAAAKTVTFPEPITLNRILIVHNTTRGVSLFNFADPSRLGTISGNVLTLACSTTGMANTDEILAYTERDDTDYERLILHIVEENNNAIYQLLAAINTLKSTMGYPDATGQMRVAVGNTVAVGVVPGITAIGGYRADDIVFALQNSGAQRLMGLIERS